MNKTAIEWTASTQPDGTITPGYTANPIRYSDAGGAAAWGCIKASEGCQHCYAESISKRFHGRGAVFTAKRMESLTPTRPPRTSGCRSEIPTIRCGGEGAPFAGSSFRRWRCRDERGTGTVADRRGARMHGGGQMRAEANGTKHAMSLHHFVEGWKS